MKKIFILLLLFIGTSWTFLNIFFLPFYSWTEGIHRPWLILNGLLPYKDFIWNRGIIDLYLLAGFYKLFGVSQMNYRIVIFIFHMLISSIIFFGLYKRSALLASISYVIYLLLSSILFSNAEIEEILVGLFSVITYFLFWQFLDKKKFLYLFYAGIASGLSFGVKQTSIVLVGIGVGYLTVNYYREMRRVPLSYYSKQVFVYIIGFFLPILLLLFFFLYNRMLNDYLYQQYFVFFVYSKWAQPWGLSDGIRMSTVYLSIIIPFFVIQSKKIVKKGELILILSFTMALFVMLLPSYWSYRLVAALPLFSIIGALYIIKLSDFLKHGDSLFKAGVICIGIISFYFSFLYFFNGYIQTVRDNGLRFGQALLDYGQDEENVARWLKTNTSKNDRVFNMANNIIMVKSARLPHNKYIDGMPLDYMPYNSTYKDIIANPPKIIIYPSSILSDFPELKEWKFLNYFKKRYQLKKQFGDLGIYYFAVK